MIDQPQPTQKRSKKTVLIIATIVIVLLCLCVGIIANLPGSTPSSGTSTTAARAIAIDTVPAETNISTPTDTPIPSSTPAPTATSSPILTPTLGLLPPSILEEAATCITENATPQKGTVVKITDGDTVDVRLEDGNIYTVRYIGIDTPEKERPFYQDAIQKNTDLVYQKEVWLFKDVSEVDQYDRLLRYVISDDYFVNLELVSVGLAQAVAYPPDTSCHDEFTAAQNQANQWQIGLWSPTQTPGPASPKVVIVAVNKEAEYVDIQNTGNTDVALSGWVLVSERGNQSCYLMGTLKAGEILRIWAGTSSQGGYSCGFTNPIWNNSESDPAVLYDPQGVGVSRK